MSTKPEDILDTFQNRSLAPVEWETLADQVLREGVQKVTDELRGGNQPAANEMSYLTHQHAHQTTPAWKTPGYRLTSSKE